MPPALPRLSAAELRSPAAAVAAPCRQAAALARVLGAPPVAPRVRSAVTVSSAMGGRALRVPRPPPPLPGPRCPSAATFLPGWADRWPRSLSPWLPPRPL
eukprot:4800239-Alexandrium_andersonii.AAC.1